MWSTFNTKVQFEEVHPPDWEAILMDLKRNRVTVRGLAERIGITRERLYAIRDKGAQPQWHFGQMILQVHKHVMENQNES